MFVIVAAAGAAAARRREVVSRCSPNAGHYALAAAEQRARQQGVDFQVITQNIDRLHQAAGSSNVIEMHGSLWWVHVMDS